MGNDGDMNVRPLHPWVLTIPEAFAVQDKLRPMITLSSTAKKEKIETVAGADISYSQKSDLLYGAVLVFSFPELKLMEITRAAGRATFPYVPGLLSFREGPILTEAFAALATRPDVLLFDGQGIAHPRGIGLASHMGLILDIPSIGCAKSRLVGEYGPVGEEPGDLTPLTHQRRQVGFAVRTKKKAKPLFVSPGHKISFRDAVEIVVACCRRYRVPEPVRQAHLEVNKLRAGG